MEIRFYDSSLNFIGLMENQTSLIWTRRYNEAGEFELYAPISEYNLKLAQIGNIVWVRGNSEAMVIEDLVLEESDTKNEITAKGRTLDSYMDRRITKATQTFQNVTVEVAMRTLFENAEPIPNVVLGDLNGFEDTVSFQVTYKNLLTYESKLAQSAGYGFRFRPDFDAKLIYFEIYKGTDRGASQSYNNRVIFSESYNNLNNVTYRENYQLYKNVAYVGGEEAEDGTRTIVKVGDSSGLALYEMFVDAKDLRQEELTDSEYEALLITRGQEKLAEVEPSVSFEADTGADVNFSYKVNYDLGDIVTIKKKAWGKYSDERISELREVYEYGGRTIEPTFGSTLPTSIDWSDN